MAISKIGSKALVDCSVAAVDIADNSITAAKLAGSIANAKLANSSVTINSTSVSLGASANINALDWQSVIVADGSTGTTGVAGRGYFINTTSAAHTFTLPVSATRGDTIAIKDYAGTFATFNLTINRNGHKIQGVENNSLISTNRASVVLVYVDVTRGWEFTTESNVADLQEALFITATGGTITTDGDFKVHSFTGDGCFVVSSVGNPVGSITVASLVVGGGGGGGYNTGGGGGSGKVTQTPSSPVTTTTYPISIGAGGVGESSLTPAPSKNGTASSFGPIVSATFGNGGLSEAANNAPGGASGQPFAGGNRGNMPAGPGSGGGGGGAGAIGLAGNPFPGIGGNGGVGLSIPTSLSPDSYGTPGPAPGRYFGGGGGGGNYGTHPTVGLGGSGGGGNGGNGPAGSNSVAGTINTGGGGGGGACGNGVSKAGGSGLVIIRYKFQ